MTTRRRVGVGTLLAVAVAAFAVTTLHGRSAWGIAAAALCMLTLGWAYVLVKDTR